MHVWRGACGPSLCSWFAVGGVTGSPAGRRRPGPIGVCAANTSDFNRWGGERVSMLVSDTSAAMLPGMTTPTPSVPPAPTVTAGPPSGPAGSAGGTLGPTVADLVDRDRLRETIARADHGAVFFLARCVRCGDSETEPLTEPFRDEAERDEWAAAHLVGTGHVVTLTVDGPHTLMVNLHMVGLVHLAPGGGYRFVCPADDCATSCGPYDRPETAIASWRQHKPMARVAR